MNQHQAAIWGAGGIAQTHAMALRAVGIPIRTVVSHSEAGARAFAEQWGIPEWSTDPAALLDASVGSVHVCTPPGLHYEMVKFLLEHDRHVLCEKPLCLDPEQAGELAHLAREKGLACAVNLNVRFHPACQEAKARVADPAFGPVFLVHGAYLQEFHALPAPDGWRYDEAVGGTMRAVTEIGTHWLDLAEYLTGERITSVQALFGCFQPQRMLKDGMMEPPEAAEGVPVTVRSEDSALLHFRMAGGAIGSAVLRGVPWPHQPPEPGNHRQKPQSVVGQRGQHRPARSVQGQRGADRPLPLRLQRLHRYLYHAGRALLCRPGLDVPGAAGGFPHL